LKEEVLEAPQTDLKPELPIVLYESEERKIEVKPVKMEEKGTLN